MSILSSQPGGLCSTAPCRPANDDEPRIRMRFSTTGDVGPLFPELAKRGVGRSIQGCGTGLDDESALVPALAEALERYSASVFRNVQFTWATAEELGRHALDMSTLPCCSETELAHPKCPLIKPDKTKPIRWVPGISLLDGEIMYVPAVMAYTGTGYASTEERFWFPISTGCAAHLSYLRAVLAGIYEVIERDAISLIWLQKLALPRIEMEYIPLELEPYWQRYENCLGDVEHHLFDATSDLGIPTVYGVQVAKHNPRVRQIVACSTGSSIVTAIAKVMRDTVPLRSALQRAHKPPDEWDDFTDLLHGASYMCRPDSAAAFDFLLNTRSRTKLDSICTTQNEKEALQHVLRILRKKKLRTYLVDLSTDEAIRCGMRVVRVIIPGLQPLSFRYRARFLGHPRLYEAPVSMGYRASPEQYLNHWPQPFA